MIKLVIRCLMPALGLLLTGCALAPVTSSTADSGKARTQVQQRVVEIIDAAQKKDFARLDSYHLYGPQFTKYSTELAGRLDADTARKGEHDGLGAAAGLWIKADDLKIDVFSGAAVATFNMRYGSNANGRSIEKQARSTLVFVNDHGSWRIVHEHLSRASAPAN